MTITKLPRRHLIKQASLLSAVGLAAASFPGCGLMGRSGSQPKAADIDKNELPFRLSLAQWSLHQRFFNGEADPLDFAAIARQEFNLDGIEYVNQFYADKLSHNLLLDLERRADDQGVRSLLIMVDGEGALGDPDDKARTGAVENHKKWAEAAVQLGCHSIRVNAESSGSYEEQAKLATDGLVRLADYCRPLGINVLVENHGGLSSNGAWLSGIMRRADLPNLGTLPDFGNFTIDKETDESYDRYQGVNELMPYAKAVSAKSYDFDDQGRETNIDYERMLRIVLNAGYNGWIGVEYEGERLPEAKGVRLTRDLLKVTGYKLI